jgi:hypothetical protein
MLNSVQNFNRIINTDTWACVYMAQEAVTISVSGIALYGSIAALQERRLWISNRSELSTEATCKHGGSTTSKCLCFIEVGVEFI